MAYIISIVLKSSSILLLIGGSLILLQNQTSKLKHFLISWSLFGLLLLPFLIEVLPALEVEVPYTQIATSEVVAINKENPVTSIAEPAYVLPSKEMHSANNLTDKDKILHSNIVPLRDEGQIVKAEKKGITISIIQILYGTWLFGSLFFLLRFLLGAFIIFRITKASHPYPIPDKLKKKLQDLTRQFPEIYCNDSIQTPMTWGLFKPVILLPKDASNWDAATLRIVLLHEGMHIHRRDYWWHIIGVLALCLYWWHPLVWIIKKRQVLEREKACDEGVLHLGTSQKAYAQTLVAMTKQLALSNKFHLEHPLSMAKKTQIKQRIMAILNFQNSSRRSTVLRQFVVAIFLILALPLIARISPIEVAKALESLPILMPIEKLPTVPAKSITITPTENKIVLNKSNIKSSVKTLDNSIDELPINTLLQSPITTLPKLAAKLPLVENTPTINIPQKEEVTGLYGEWKDRKSTYKVWTYGDFTTQKNIPFIQTSTVDAFVIIEETRKTILGKKKFLLAITKAPDDGGVIHSFLNGQPQSLSGGYKKGEPVLLWWEDGEWGGFWSKSKDKWIAKKMGRIIPLLELLEHIDFIKPVSKQDSEWWSVIKEHQRIKKERYFINDPINNVKVVAPTLKFQDIPYKELSVTQRNSNKKVGRTNASKTKSGCSGCSDLLETKYGTIIKTSSQPSLVKTLNIHLADNKFESLEFDMNLYKVKNGEVLYRLTEVPVPFKIGKQENWVSVDLSAHNIPVQGDVLVMLEPKKVTGKKRTLFFSLSTTHWLYKPFSKKNQQNLEDFWDNSFALYFTLK